MSQASWFSNMKRVAEVACVEDFWGYPHLIPRKKIFFAISVMWFQDCSDPRLYNNVRPPSKIASGSNYHLFKLDVQVPSAPGR